MKDYTDSYNYSLQKNIATDDIKKGLERIKQAQIEVLRELKRDDPEHSRNQSLTYSKDSIFEVKSRFKFDRDAAELSKEKKSFEEIGYKDIKIREENNALVEEVRKTREACQRAEKKVSEYEKSESKALLKAQEALANAISSEKKYIALKGEFDRLNKEKVIQENTFKKLQRKEILNLTNSSQNSSNLPSKIVKDLLSIQEYLCELSAVLNAHQCFKKELNDPSNPSAPNLASVSKINEKIDKSLNNLIIYFRKLANTSSIHNSNDQKDEEYDNLLSGSFREDIKKIEEEINIQSNEKEEKIKELESLNHSFERKVSKLQSEIQQNLGEIRLLKTKVKILAKENEEHRFSYKILQEEYEKFKERSNNKTKALSEEKNANMNSKGVISNSSSNSDRNAFFEEQSKRNIELLEDRIIDLEKENSALVEEEKKSSEMKKNQREIIEKLKLELETTNNSKQELETEHSYEINKLNAKANFTTSNNLKSQLEWDEMIFTIRKFQEERILLIENQKETKEQFDRESAKYESDVRDLELALKAVKEEIQELRKENAAILFDQTELTRLRNLENSQQEAFVYNKTVDELWYKKEGEYENVHHVLGKVRNNYGLDQDQYYKLPSQPVSFMRYPQNDSLNTQLPTRNINEINQQIYQYHHISQANTQGNFMANYQDSHSVPMIYRTDYPIVQPQPR